MSERDIDAESAASVPTLAIRAEGRSGHGTGHIARSVALAQAWCDRRGESILVTDDVPATWLERLRSAGIRIAKTSEPPVADWWVIDGYELGLDQVPDDVLVARIDDFGRSPEGRTDLLIDQNLGASAATYSGRSDSLLLGPRYALLRRDLIAAAKQRRERPPAGQGGPLKLLVLKGGAPALETSRRVDEILADPRLARFETEVLSGSDDPVPGLLNADLALAAAGTSVWELLAFGIPSVLYTVADNQEPLAGAVAHAGLATSVGPLASVTIDDAVSALEDLADAPAMRAERSAEGSRLVDGLGSARVVTRLRAGLVSLRHAEDADIERVYGWNNDPRARASSFSVAPIPWTSHVRWFRRRLEDPSATMLIASDHNGVDLGVVRFSLDGTETTMGIALDISRQNQGWGSAVIEAACDRLFRMRGHRSVLAFVKVTNTASRRAFLGADFVVDAESGASREATRLVREI